MPKNGSQKTGSRSTLLCFSRVFLGAHRGLAPVAGHVLESLERRVTSLAVLLLLCLFMKNEKGIMWLVDSNSGMNHHKGGLSLPKKPPPTISRSKRESDKLLSP